MSNLVYKEIDKKDKEKLMKLTDTVLECLEKPEFFISFTDEDIKIMFDKDKAITYGVYDSEELVATAQLYLQEEYVKEVKKILGIEDKKVSELGGYLVLPEYRNQGIMRKLQSILESEAKKTGCEYAVITAHPENAPSNSVIKHTGAKLVKTSKLEGYLRNIYLLELK